LATQYRNYVPSAFGLESLGLIDVEIRVLAIYLSETGLKWFESDLMEYNDTESRVLENGVPHFMKATQSVFLLLIIFN